MNQFLNQSLPGISASVEKTAGQQNILYRLNLTGIGCQCMKSHSLIQE